MTTDQIRAAYDEAVREILAAHTTEMQAIAAEARMHGEFETGA